MIIKCIIFKTSEVCTTNSLVQIGTCDVDVSSLLYFFIWLQITETSSCFNYMMNYHVLSTPCVYDPLKWSDWITWSTINVTVASYNTNYIKIQSWFVTNWHSLLKASFNSVEYCSKTVEKFWFLTKAIKTNDKLSYLKKKWINSIVTNFIAIVTKSLKKHLWPLLLNKQ